MHPFYQSAWELSDNAATSSTEQQGESSNTDNGNGDRNENNNDNDNELDFQESSLNNGKQRSKGKRSRRDYEENNDSDDDDSRATECPICFKGVSNQGDHCLVVTKCGHTFGEICIMKWIIAKQKERVPPRCPNCGQNGPILKKADLRRIVITKLIAHDTSDLERIRKELAEAKKAIDEKTKEIMSLKGHIKLLNQSQSAKDLEALQSKIVALSSTRLNNESLKEEEKEEKKKIREFYSYPLEYQQQGRSLAISAMDEMAVISVGNANTGFGLQRISLRDIQSVDYFPNHKKMIRDVKCSPFQQSLVLSTGLDNKLALTCVRNKHIIQAYGLETPGWSCDFDEIDSNLLYCGLANNAVLVYDIRNTKNYLHRLRPPNTTGNFPIHSLAVTTKADHNDGARMILCSNTVGSFLWELNVAASSEDQEPEFHPLSCTQHEGYKPYSLSYDHGAQTILISSRRLPAMNGGGTFHSLYQLNKEQIQENEGQVERMWSFESSYPQIQMSRTYHYVGDQSEDGITCFSNNENVLLRSPQEEIGSFSVKGPVMDIKLKQVGQDLVIGALTDKTLHLYKY
ncbi:hypothetical protein BDA99DRAFT_141390 [Phascolomyces articulosus]|uniref:RING-type E3 ubiquitin transferase n=1 Tax=Phascolomyces articulosus TaxID=60185 RepID=A0AAD5JVI8_9FUNG|nr:hypothetical protein BDA99DRAFT_141390 [Phascolomyces articulosus]